LGERATKDSRREGSDGGGQREGSDSEGSDSEGSDSEGRGAERHLWPSQGKQGSRRRPGR